MPPSLSESPLETFRKIYAGRDYFEHVAGDVHIQNTADAQDRIDPAALCEAYLNWLIRKAGYLPLADIDPQMAATESDAPLNLNAIYTALLTLTPEEHKQLRPDSSSQGERKSALAQLNEQSSLVLLGGPGSGKSTFVNFATICLAGEWLQRPDINLKRLRTPLPTSDEQKDVPPQPWQHEALLPVRVLLRELAATGLPSEGEPLTSTCLWDFIAHDLEQEGLGDFAPFLKRHLLEQGGLIFLDGLDEVPETDHTRMQIKHTVECCRSLFPRCRVLVTSRTYAYQRREWKLSGFHETVLSTFSDAQIQSFVRHWYVFLASFRDMKQNDALAQAEELYTNILNNSRLHELAERPILLTLMTSLHASRGRLPEKRVELYQETVGLLLHRWEWQKLPRSNAQQGESDTEYHSVLRWLDVDRDSMLGLLGKLAYEAHTLQPEQQEDSASIDASNLIMGLWKLKKASQVTVEQIEFHLRLRAGVLISPDEGVYSFPHRSFQEYLAAYYLTSQQDYPDNIADLVRADPNRWREVLLLAAAIVAKAGPMIWLLVDALCFQDLHSPHLTEADAWGALLAGQALTEAADLSALHPRNRQKLNRVTEWLVAILSEKRPQNSPLPVVERALAGNLLAQLGDPRAGVGQSEAGLPDIKWCDVPKGVFLMGSDPEKENPEKLLEEISKQYARAQATLKDDVKTILQRLLFSEQPQHQVLLSDYCISRYPATNAQYQIFVEEGGYSERWRECWSEEGWTWKAQENISRPEHFSNKEFYLPNHPVVGVSWYEASAFCAWLTLRLREAGELSKKQEIRLPTEAEWEKAARGPDGRIYPWGDEKINPERVNYYETGLGVTSPVGCFPRGKSPYDCEEMAGNVYEWCRDWYDEKYYSNSPKKNPQGPASGSKRVVRGGGWGFFAEFCRAAYRNGNGPGDRLDDVGFRLLRT